MHFQDSRYEHFTMFLWICSEHRKTRRKQKLQPTLDINFVSNDATPVRSRIGHDVSVLKVCEQCMSNRVRVGSTPDIANIAYIMGAILTRQVVRRPIGPD